MKQQQNERNKKKTSKETVKKQKFGSNQMFGSGFVRFYVFLVISLSSFSPFPPYLISPSHQKF